MTDAMQSLDRHATYIVAAFVGGAIGSEQDSDV